MTRFLLLTLALMCENVNATDPQRGLNRDLSAGTRHSEPDGSATKPARPSSQGGASQGTAPILFKNAALQYRDEVTSQVGAIGDPRTASAAPFMFSHPLCQTGFTISQRLDTRNSAGTIIKSVWVRKCARTPRIVFTKSL
jgi:hypothetical protein